MRHRQLYALLKSAGHSPAKAAEILLDASRGDDLARFWVFTQFRTRPRSRTRQFLDELHQRHVAATR